MRSGFRVVLGAFVGAATSWLAFQPEAHAESLAPCGDIHVEARAECEVVAPGVECEARCTPLSVQAACAARLTAECEGMCNLSASAQCQADCRGQCTGQCTVDPGAFDCSAECQARCGGECDATCSAAADRAQCEASCQGSCSASCDAKCDVQLPEADCNAQCNASCEGSCEAEINADCQVMCQSELYADCEFEVKGGCEAACETNEGALFCDSQYVDHGNNLQQCVAALQAALNIQVEGYAEGSSSCAGGMCEAEGSAGVSCSATHWGASTFGMWGLLGLSLGLVRRRRR